MYINSAVSSKNISIYINLKNNKYCIFKDSRKIIEVSYDKSNILKEFYSLIKQEIVEYNSLNEKEKIQRILNKYDIRCDFTKKKHSYQINSRHLVLTESMDKTKFLKLLETKDSETIKTILHNFILAVLDKKRICESLPGNVYYKIKEAKSYKDKRYLYVPEEEKYKTRACCIEFGSGIIPIPLFRNVCKFNIDNKIYLTDIDIKKFIELMKPASPRYLIDRIQELDYVNISKEKDDIYIFNADLTRRDIDYDILLYTIVNGFELSGKGVDIDENYYFPMEPRTKGEIKYNYKYQHII